MNTYILRETLGMILVVLTTLPVSVYMHKASLFIIRWIRERFKYNDKQMAFIILGVCITRFNLLLLLVHICYEIIEKI